MLVHVKQQKITIMRFHRSYKTTSFVTEVTTILLFVQMEFAKSLIIQKDDLAKMNSVKWGNGEFTFDQKPAGLSLNSFYKAPAYGQTNFGSIWDKPSPERGAKPAPSRSQLASRNTTSARRLFKLLSTGTLSVADPFQYLICETNKINASEIGELEVQLRSRLETNEIPESLMPHARALQSIITGVLAAGDLKRYTQGIRDDPHRSTIPSEISTPPDLAEFGLFSPDVFADPDIPARLLIKLMQIPRDEIPKLSIQLKNYIENTRKSRYSTGVWLWYTGYAEKVISYLQRDRILDDLRRDMAEIRRISTFAGSGSTLEPDTASSNPTEDSPKINNASKQLSKLLSVKNLSTIRPFRNLIFETSELPEWDLNNLDVELHSRLETNGIPDRYIPYARALQSIIRCQKELFETKWNIRNMQYDYTEVPVEIESPPALSKYDLFSRFVFRDPIPPNQLLARLLRIPQNDTPNVKILLRNYTEISKDKKWRTATVAWWRYIWHAETLLQFLQKDTLDDLRRNMDEIQRLSTPA